MFALANPTPEVDPEEIEDLAAVIATGRSDYPNQINNVLAFPGVFRGALDVRARAITHEMQIAAANALAGVIADDELAADYSCRASSTATSHRPWPGPWPRPPWQKGSHATTWR